MKIISLILFSFLGIEARASLPSVATGSLSESAHLLPYAETFTPLRPTAESIRPPSGLEQPLLLAQGKNQARKKVRKRRLSAEGKFTRSGDKTTIDFDSVDIVGSRRTPLGSMINQNRASKEYDFVKVRLRWHPEMINSASSLDTGD